MKTMANRQRGVSLSGLLMLAGVLVFSGIVAMKLIPAYMQDKEIQSIFSAIVHDPDMQNAPIKDIRMSYSKRSMVANVTAIKAEDVEIGKEGKSISLSASYSIKVPVAANVSLLLEFNPSSSN